ncbi:NAD(P)-binding protein, partial [Kineococcus sp. T13]|uniref:NAD(P)-binding protein n=1 Tax=Kineococcus vitellinus TaxID=2696565 RepID=UPI0014122D57|nr:NAD(P)-binding protein [Kineococcus vitellinus]
MHRVDDDLPGDVPGELPEDSPEDLLTALVEAVTARTRDPAPAVRALREVLTGDRPDWAARAARALAALEAAARARGTTFAAAPAQQRLAVLEDLRADADQRWLAALVQDVHHADPATWAEVGWRPGTTVDDVDPDALAALDDLARSLTPPQRVAERYDVVVVGSGAGGGVAAWKLAASGRRVLLVERAAWTGTAALARDHLRNPRSPSGLAGTGEPREPRSLLTPAGRSLHRPGDPRWGANAMTVGGGTRLYGAQAWRFAPDDFRMATRYGVPDGSALADWPIDHDDLEPYYDEAEWELGVSGRAGGDPWAGPRSRDYPMPPLPATAQVALLERGARALGLGTLPVPLLVNSRPRDGRGACVRCTQCVGFACPVGARGGSHTTALPRALATGACTVVAGARAER